MSMSEFDPDRCAVVVEMDARALRAVFPDDALAHATAWAFPEDIAGNAQTEQAYAVVDFTRVGYSSAVEAGCSIEEAAGPHEQLQRLHQFLFDERGKLRKEHGTLGQGNDLLLIDQASVAPGHNFDSILDELLEHVLTHYSQNCFAVAYIDDPQPDFKMHQFLSRHGFEWHPQEDGGFYVLRLDIGEARPTSDSFPQ